MNDYLKDYRPPAKKEYVRYVRKLAEHFGCDPLTLSEDQLRACFLFLRQEKHYTRSPMKAAKFSLRSFFVDGHHLTGWTVFSEVRIAEPLILPVVLSREEVAAVLGAVREPRLRVGLERIYHCGLRVGEAVRVEVRDLHESRSQQPRLHVRQGRGGGDRFVPMCPRMVERLRHWWRQHQHPVWLFPGPGLGWRERGHTALEAAARATTHLSVSAVQNTFRLARAQSGINAAATPHTLRHSYATHLLEEGRVAAPDLALPRPCLAGHDGDLHAPDVRQRGAHARGAGDLAPGGGRKWEVRELSLLPPFLTGPPAHLLPSHAQPGGHPPRALAGLRAHVRQRDRARAAPGRGGHPELSHPAARRAALSLRVWRVAPRVSFVRPPRVSPVRPGRREGLGHPPGEQAAARAVLSGHLHRAGGTARSDPRPPNRSLRRALQEPPAPMAGARTPGPAQTDSRARVEKILGGGCATGGPRDHGAALPGRLRAEDRPERRPLDRLRRAHRHLHASRPRHRPDPRAAPERGRVPAALPPACAADGLSESAPLWLAESGGEATVGTHSCVAGLEARRAAGGRRRAVLGAAVSALPEAEMRLLGTFARSPP